MGRGKKFSRLICRMSNPNRWAVYITGPGSYIFAGKKIPVASGQENGYASSELAYCLIGKNGYDTFTEYKDFETDFIGTEDSFNVGIQNYWHNGWCGRLFQIYDLILVEEV